MGIWPVNDLSMHKLPELDLLHLFLLQDSTITCRQERISAPIAQRSIVAYVRDHLRLVHSDHHLERVHGSPRPTFKMPTGCCFELHNQRILVTVHRKPVFWTG